MLFGKKKTIEYENTKGSTDNKRRQGDDEYQDRPSDPCFVPNQRQNNQRQNEYLGAKKDVLERGCRPGERPGEVSFIAGSGSRPKPNQVVNSPITPAGPIITSK